MHLEDWWGRLLNVEIEVSVKCSLVVGIKVHWKHWLGRLLKVEVEVGEMWQRCRIESALEDWFGRLLTVQGAVSGNVAGLKD